MKFIFYPLKNIKFDMAKLYIFNRSKNSFISKKKNIQSAQFKHNTDKSNLSSCRWPFVIFCLTNPDSSNQQHFKNTVLNLQNINNKFNSLTLLCSCRLVMTFLEANQRIYRRILIFFVRNKP